MSLEPHTECMLNECVLTVKILPPGVPGILMKGPKSQASKTLRQFLVYCYFSKSKNSCDTGCVSVPARVCVWKGVLHVCVLGHCVKREVS